MNMNRGNWVALIIWEKLYETQILSTRRSIIQKQREPCYISCAWLSVRQWAAKLLQGANTKALDIAGEWVRFIKNNFCNKNRGAVVIS